MSATGDPLGRKLLATYLGELEERVQALNRDLLRLERETHGDARTGLLETLLRTAHSLKGASRSVSATLIESACHRIEELLARLQEGLVSLEPDVFQLLFSTTDAIEDAGRRLRDGRDLAGAPLVEWLKRLEAAGEPRGACPPGRPASTRHESPPESPEADSGLVRLPASKLDDLLAESGELLVARRREHARAETIATLRDFLRQWRSEWASGTRTLWRQLPHPAAAASPSGRASRSAASTARAALVVERTDQRLRQLERDLDRLAENLEEDARRSERAAIRLNEQVHRVRMLPLAQACERLDRMVRDLATAAGKEIDLLIEGGDVEMDRSVLERLKDPLIHLVRNAVDHGIEAPEERRGRGKPPRGRIVVSAAIHGSQVRVTVDDDGRGLDREALRTQARRMGLSEPADDRLLARLVLQPGVTTAPRLTELSGRGMGLDVVRRAAESLHGSVSVSFEAGCGARFALTVPLTLTTIRVLLLSAEGETFAVASTSVRLLLRARREDFGSVEGRPVLLLGGAPVPAASLAETLGLAPRGEIRVENRVPVAVLSSGDREVAFLVEELLAEHEAVVKSLGPRLEGMADFAGATLLPTGRPALILNPSTLVERALGNRPAFDLAEEPATGERPARKRLLVVDDSVTTRALEKDILEAAGYEVTVAVDGADAWQILQQSGADLVVTDIEMPRMDGFALTEAIRGSTRYRDLPVVLVTALESEEDRRRGMETGASAYLVKSAFDQRVLLDAVAQLL